MDKKNTILVIVFLTTFFISVIDSKIQFFCKASAANSIEEEYQNLNNDIESKNSILRDAEAYVVVQAILLVTASSSIQSFDNTYNKMSDVERLKEADMYLVLNHYLRTFEYFATLNALLIQVQYQKDTYLNDRQSLLISKLTKIEDCPFYLSILGNCPSPKEVTFNKIKFLKEEIISEANLKNEKEKEFEDYLEVVQNELGVLLQKKEELLKDNPFLKQENNESKPIEENSKSKDKIIYI